MKTELNKWQPGGLPHLRGWWIVVWLEIDHHYILPTKTGRARRFRDFHKCKALCDQLNTSGARP